MRASQSAILAGVLALAAGIAFAGDSEARTTYVVRPDGSGDFPTIQAAINAAVGGDVIELTNGIFQGYDNMDLDLLGKAITIRSQSGDPATCIINCAEPEPILHHGFRFYNQEGADTVIEGVTVKNAQQFDGGAIWAVDYSSPTFRNCVFTHNEAHYGGGALYCYDCGVRFEDCVFSWNQSQTDGGVAIMYHWGAPRFTRCRFENNFAPGGSGGALYVPAFATPVIIDCTFADNVAAVTGGAISSSGAYDVTSSTFSGNYAGDRGGAIFSIYRFPDLVGCTFSDNEADQRGGALYCGTGEFPESGASLTSCTLVRNGAPEGGGVYAETGNASLDRTIITFGTAGGAYRCGPGTWNPTIECSDLFGNAGGDYVGCADVYPGYDNISADPIFCNAVADNFTLRDDSPCAAPNNAACGQVGAHGIGCTVIDVPGAASSIAAVLRATPNPSTGVFNIEYRHPGGGELEIEIFDIAGRRIRSFRPAPASGVIHWDAMTGAAQPAAPGTYFVRLRRDGHDRVERLQLVR